MGKLKYYVAATLDGFIAQPDGSFGGFVWNDAFTAEFLASLRDFGVVLMGRKTYEVGLREGVTSPYPFLRQFVFSRSMEASPDPAVTLVRDGAVDVVRALRADSPDDLWLCGGADLASTLFEAGLIDEVIVKVNPVLIGRGIPLFARPVPQTALELTRARTHDETGIAVLHYRVKR